MILSLLFVLLAAQVYGQQFQAAEKDLVQPVAAAADQDTCSPQCRPGECCVRMSMPMVSRKRAAAAVAYGRGDLLGPYGGFYTYLCQPLRQQGHTCLLHTDPHEHQEWCPCATGLTCTKSKEGEDVEMSNILGTCQ
ncbi:uncharacterized protein LOC143300049 isoform X2 [Babylonia areolata]|uniref:uncharacterized protein LOC143300049 isoform X2 n=1 Tax=Babylonia areolata TaxID=304850 RepID=UPI003FCF1629